MCIVPGSSLSTLLVLYQYSLMSMPLKLIPFLSSPFCIWKMHMLFITHQRSYHYKVAESGFEPRAQTLICCTLLYSTISQTPRDKHILCQAVIRCQVFCRKIKQNKEKGIIGSTNFRWGTQGRYIGLLGLS